MLTKKRKRSLIRKDSTAAMFYCNIFDNDDSKEPYRTKVGLQLVKLQWKIAYHDKLRFFIYIKLIYRSRLSLCWITCFSTQIASENNHSYPESQQEKLLVFLLEELLSLVSTMG